MQESYTSRTVYYICYTLKMRKLYDFFAKNPRDKAVLGKNYPKRNL